MAGTLVSKDGLKSHIQRSLICKVLHDLFLNSLVSCHIYNFVQYLLLPAPWHSKLILKKPLGCDFCDTFNPRYEVRKNLLTHWSKSWIGAGYNFLAKAASVLCRGPARLSTQSCCPICRMHHHFPTFPYFTCVRLGRFGFLLCAGAPGASDKESWQRFPIFTSLAVAIGCPVPSRQSAPEISLTELCLGVQHWGHGDPEHIAPSLPPSSCTTQTHKSPLGSSPCTCWFLFLLILLLDPSPQLKTSFPPRRLCWLCWIPILWHYDSLWPTVFPKGGHPTCSYHMTLTLPPSHGTRSVPSPWTWAELCGCLDW
jgi:hypothetical protein